MRSAAKVLVRSCDTVLGTHTMSSRSPAAAETVHRVTATLLGRHRRRPRLQRLAPDAALFDDSPHLAGQDRPTKSGAQSPRRGLPRSARWCSPAATQARDVTRCAWPRCRERSMLGVGPASRSRGLDQGAARGEFGPRGPPRLRNPGLWGRPDTTANQRSRPGSGSMMADKGVEFDVLVEIPSSTSTAR